MIKVGNAAAISFQQATKANTKLGGVCNLRDKRVQELRDDANVVTAKACATLNLSTSDVLTIAKCLQLTATVRTKRLTQLDRLVYGLRGRYVRRLGSAIGAGALPGMNKYRTTAGG